MAGTARGGQVQSFFCRCGWQPWQVQFHGRWGSDAVLGYTEEVFAEVSGSWRLDGAVSESVAGAVGNVESEGVGVVVSVLC